MTIMDSIWRLAGRVLPARATPVDTGAPAGTDVRAVDAGEALQLDPIAAWLMTDDVAARIVATRLLVGADLDMPDWEDTLAPTVSADAQADQVGQREHQTHPPLPHPVAERGQARGQVGQAGGGAGQGLPAPLRWRPSWSTTRA